MPFTSLTNYDLQDNIFLENVRGHFSELLYKYNMIILSPHAKNGNKILKNDRDFVIYKIFWQLCQNTSYQHKMSVIRQNVNIFRSTFC